MTRFAIRGLLSRKLRTALTAIAIVLGVAMISGTYVLTDTITSAYTTIVNDSSNGGLIAPLPSERSKAALPLMTTFDPFRESVKIELNAESMESVRT